MSTDFFLNSDFRYENPPFYECGWDPGESRFGWIYDLVLVHLELLCLVASLVLSKTACLANSPGSRRRTVIVERLL